MNGKITLPQIRFLLLCAGLKRLILAAAFSAAALCTFADRSPAGTITFTGVVDQVQAPFNPAHLMIGDTFSGTFVFNSGPPDANEFPITHYSITVGEFSFSGTPGGGEDLVALLTDPGQGAVFYQVRNLVAPNPGPYALVDVEVTLQTGTPNGVIPPLDQFALNDFAIGLFLSNDPYEFPEGVFGHLTSLPTLNLAVPDGGTSMTLLSCGLTGLAMLRCWLRPKSTT